jgi:hypothetical protein
MDADTVLNNVKETYASFHSYADEGTFISPTASYDSALEFKTYYLRPQKILFQ